MPLELLDPWSPPGLLLESEAEAEFSRILESGPGTQARAVFARSEGWRHALKSVAGDPGAIARSRLIVFPQTQVLHYRADFLVVCANVAPVMKRSALSHLGFFVECDGLVGHAETAEQVLDDRRREQAVRRETGMDVLRFSGAEVMYQRREVQAVLGAQIGAMAALREFGDAVRSEADVVLRTVADLTAHRALRNDYTVRNSARSQAEPYDWSDPFGESGFAPEMLREAGWEPFLRLRVDIARLAYSVARARQALPEVQEYEHEGEFLSFGEALVEAIEKAYDNFRGRVM